jgi:uncharacterized protein YlaN (UPF0358 family)
MAAVQQLQTNISNLQTVCKSIFSDALNIRKDIKVYEDNLCNEDDHYDNFDAFEACKLYKFFKKANINTVEEQNNVIQDMKNYIIEATDDPLTVTAEIDAFSEAVVSDSDFGKCPFMENVWKGDMYGVDRYEALQQLHTDLEKSHKNLLSTKALFRAVTKQTVTTEK